MTIRAWNEPTVAPPTPGVYERDYGNGYPMLSFWDGKEWGFTEYMARRRPSKLMLNAVETYRFPPSAKQNLRWRMVAK